MTFDERKKYALRGNENGKKKYIDVSKEGILMRKQVPLVLSSEQLFCDEKKYFSAECFSFKAWQLKREKVAVKLFRNKHIFNCFIQTSYS